MNYSPPLKAKFDSKVFLAREKAMTLLSINQPKRILFSGSKPDWNQIIAHGFRKTPHQIDFRDLQRSKYSDYDLVVPFTIPDLRHLSGLRHLLTHNPIPIPSRSSLDLCDNKIHFNNRMAQLGFGEYIPPIGRGLGYPYILKKNIDGAGANCFAITGLGEERRFTGILEHPDFFCQKAICGNREHATHMVIRNGELICSLNIEYTFASNLPIKGKEDYLYTRIRPCPHLELFTEMLREIGFEGLCCVNYKQEGDHPWIFEINPRFGGSLCSFFFSFMRHL